MTSLYHTITTDLKRLDSDRCVCLEFRHRNRPSRRAETTFLPGLRPLLGLVANATGSCAPSRFGKALLASNLAARGLQTGWTATCPPLCRCVFALPHRAAPELLQRGGQQTRMELRLKGHKHMGDRARALGPAPRSSAAARSPSSSIRNRGQRLNLRQRCGREEGREVVNRVGRFSASDASGQALTHTGSASIWLWSWKCDVRTPGLMSE